MYSGYNELFGFLTFPFLGFNFFSILLIIAIVVIVSWLLFRNTSKAAVFTFFVALFCLVFGYLHDSLKQLHAPEWLTKFTVILPVISLLLVVLFIYLRKRKKSFTELYLFLNLLFVILLLSEIPNSIRRYRLDKSVHNLIDFRFNVLNAYKPSVQLADSLKPDIFFLVFDAMGSSKSLQSGLGRNNYRLDSFLRQQGFYVAANAKANYNWTIHSLSSTLNMDYLPGWIAPVMNDPKAYFWGSASFLDNSLFAVLKKEGYNIHSYQPISFDNKDWPGTSYFNGLRKNHFYYKTLPGRIFRDIFWNYSKIDIGFIKQMQMQIIKDRNIEKKTYFDTTRALIKIASSFSGKPKFVYGHFMLPHDPYIFDSSGHVKSPAETIIKRKEDDVDAYFQQVLYAGKVIKELVTYIQQHNKRNAVIIIEGDHGYRSFENTEHQNYAFQNFSAIYFPDQKYELLNDSLTPVNTFRVVLNKYFAAGLPLLKDSSTLVTQQKETIRKSEKIQPARIP